MTNTNLVPRRVQIPRDFHLSVFGLTGTTCSFVGHHTVSEGKRQGKSHNGQSKSFNHVRYVSPYKGTVACFKLFLSWPRVPAVRAQAHFCPVKANAVCVCHPVQKSPVSSQTLEVWSEGKLRVTEQAPGLPVSPCTTRAGVWARHKGLLPCKAVSRCAEKVTPYLASLQRTSRRGLIHSD